jgi:hypothetical protein
VALSVQRLELGEDGIFAEAVDHEGPVPALAHSLVAGPVGDLDVLGEDPALSLEISSSRKRSRAEGV